MLLLYNVVLVSAVQQSEHYTYPIFFGFPSLEVTAEH